MREGGWEVGGREGGSVGGRVKGREGGWEKKGTGNDGEEGR